MLNSGFQVKIDDLVIMIENDSLGHENIHYLLNSSFCVKMGVKEKIQV